MSGFEIDFDLAKRTADRSLLAPRFRAAVERALADCEKKNLKAEVHETYRSNALQAVYYARGRTVKPPHRTVTNAPTNLYSWHGYGLAVDVVHADDLWAPKQQGWWRSVADIFKAHGCKWGGEWTTPDLPHFQWGLCRASPSDRARELMRTGGVVAVWEAVGALD